jgi:hypothetical protein
MSLGIADSRHVELVDRLTSVYHKSADKSKSDDDGGGGDAAAADGGGEGGHGGDGDGWTVQEAKVRVVLGSCSLLFMRASGR